MAHQSYEEAKKFVIKGLWLLAIVTLIEVGISLLGKGHLIEGADKWTWLVITAALIIGALSLYKAYFIVYFFMHLGHEVKGMRWSVLLPCLLLVWAIIAFMQEGSAWGERRQQIKDKDAEPISPTVDIQNDEETYRGLI